MRNAAFNRARERELFKGENRQFWVTVDGNFLDICVLGWCKLFAEKNGKHRWQTVVTNEIEFNSGLLNHIQCTDVKFDDYRHHVKEYRDKFISHLDDGNVMNIPTLDFIKDSVIYLYTYLLKNEQIDNCLSDAPRDISAYYEDNLREAAALYQNVILIEGRSKASLSNRSGGSKR